MINVMYILQINQGKISSILIQLPSHMYATYVLIATNSLDVIRSLTFYLIAYEVDGNLILMKSLPSTEKYYFVHISTD